MQHAPRAPRAPRPRSPRPAPRPALRSAPCPAPRSAIPILWLAGALAACGTTVGGNKPVGKTVDSDAQLQRYLRRAYLDLSGKPPGDGDLADATTRLRDAGNTAAARGELVDGLIARDGFAAAWIGELENAIFGGNSLDQQYAMVCGIIRGTTPVCMSCTQSDACACACPQLQPLAAERDQLRTAAADLRGGQTAAIERRYAMATGYYALAGAAEARVTALFDDFLARTAEADEVENGRAMILGSLIPGAPAGLLFHRLGASYGDLIDIVFRSEVYREAIVRRVFDRYLARSPSAAELAHFVTALDNQATDPDARSVIRAVVTSREYFAQ